MKTTSPQKINDAISLLHQGISYRNVASRLSISKSMVSKIQKTHFPGRKSPQGGRPRLISTRQENLIIRKIVSGELDTAVDVKKSLQQHQQVNVSADTVRRVLKRKGMKSAVKIKKPLLRLRHVRDRFAFAKRHQYWSVDDWKRVIWSDETKINRFGSDGRKWCWKTPTGGLQSRHVSKTVKHGGGSIMIWGCMTASGPGFMTKIDGGLDSELYCRILDDELRKTIDWYKLNRGKLIFQHDNDPKHTAKRTKEWIRNNHLQTLEWPAQSPDLNPIENLWNLLKRKLASYERAPTGVLDLWERVQVEWDKITREDCLHLIESMPDRISAVLKAKGGYTKY